MRPLFVWLVRAAFAVFAVACFLILLAFCYTSPGVKTAVAAHDGCTDDQARDAVRRRNAQLATAGRMKESFRVIRSEGRLEQYRTPNGDYWVQAGSAEDLATLLAEQELGEYDAATVKPGAVVVDVGACIGTYARRALVAGAGRVIAVEPDPLNLECLRRNLGAEIAAGRVTIYPKGLWNRDDTLVLHENPTHPGGHTILGLENREYAQSVSVPLTTMDKMVSELGLTRVDVVKMDIEGAEENALRGAVETLRRFQPTMAVCVYHRPQDPRVIPEVVRAANPAYRGNLDHCVEYTWREIRPEVMIFR